MENTKFAPTFPTTSSSLHGLEFTFVLNFNNAEKSVVEKLFASHLVCHHFCTRPHNVKTNLGGGEESLRKANIFTALTTLSSIFTESLFAAAICPSD